jgi:glycosyltransferase involved in cell wall biosynthesis
MMWEDKYRFHLLGLAHLPVSETYMACAFTQKIVKLSKMLLSLGHQVYLYGAEGSDAPCTEFIQTHTLKDIRDAWGDGDDRFPIGYDWTTQQFRHDFSGKRTKATRKYYDVAAKAIIDRKRPDDFLLLTQGVYQKPIADAVGIELTVEPGVGYRGSYSLYRAFESASLMNFTYGSEYPFASIKASNYWRVIPNYFNLRDFPFVEEKDDYYLFIGRMIFQKGINIAIDATRALGAKLVLAGQPDPDDYDLSNLPPHCEYVGYADPALRASLMGNARAVFVPTLYLEAFGGVSVEAQLCGTPVITSNFGCFPENVRHGETGFLCNTLQDFVDAGRKAGFLNPLRIRKHAERYSMDVVKYEYDRWFHELYRLYESIVDQSKKAWNYVDGLDNKQNTGVG